jgi:tetratricopeptide (TPR) repeat protein
MRLLALLLVSGLAAGLLRGQEVSSSAKLPADDWIAAQYGLRMALPATWASRKAEVQSEVFRAEFHRPDADGERLALRLFPQAQVGGAEDARRLSIQSVRGSADYSEPISAEIEFQGSLATAFTVDVLRDSPELRLRHLYLEHAGHVVVLESIAAVDEFESSWPDHLELWEALEFFEPESPRATEADARRERLASLAARCGQDVQWAASWSEAAARGRAEHKPVLLALRAYRGFQITDPNSSGVLMDPAWVELLNSRTVPLRLSSTRGLPFESFESYGLSGTTFGATWLLVTPEGEVVSDQPYPLYEPFVEALDALEQWPGEALPTGATNLDRARALATRGHLEEAAASLGDSAAESLLKVELARRQRDGQRMLELLEGSIHPPELDAAQRFEAGIQGVRALAGLGRAEAAAEALSALKESLDEASSDPDRGAVALLEGRLRWCAGDFDGARAAFEQTTRLAPDEPPGAIAAATLLSTSWEVQSVPRLAWLGPRDTEALAPAPYAPLPIGEAAAAAEQALAWLLEAQRPDGLWFEPAAAGRSPGAPPHDFQLATSAIALRALLRWPTSPAIEAALKRGTSAVLEGWAAQRADEGAVFFMDYVVWSRACLLDLLADLTADERLERARAEQLATIAYEELVARVQPNGGWSYYLTTDLSAASSAAQSISFTTAAVVLGMLRARDAGLLTGDSVDAVIEAALDQLERMRDADGRGPVCTLALLRGGRAEVQDLEAALYRFTVHRAAYAREVGRALMHTGRQGEGSHYLTWDYAMAAEATEALDRVEASRYRDPILEELLRTRLTGGAFMGSPLVGRAHGTAEALRTFASLEIVARE